MFELKVYFKKFIYENYNSIVRLTAVILIRFDQTQCQSPPKKKSTFRMSSLISYFLIKVCNYEPTNLKKYEIIRICQV